LLRHGRRLTNDESIQHGSYDRQTGLSSARKERGGLALTEGIKIHLWAVFRGAQLRRAEDIYVYCLEGY
jgi:hypothetical protein